MADSGRARPAGAAGPEATTRTVPRFPIQAIVAVATLVTAGAAWAHRLDPGLLVLEVSGAEVRGTWTPPVAAPDALPLLPAGCVPRSPPPGARGVRATCPAPLRGALGRTGPGAAGAEVVVRLHRGERVDTATIDADTPLLHVSADSEPPGRAAALWQALRQGVPHVLGGTDHVLFVVGMVLLVGAPARLVGAITAFTLAHSLTLGLAALGALHLPSRPVEACIALSILLLAVELRLERPTLSRRHPWLLAGSFGLVHGLGFAGALAEGGLPPGRALETLLGFNMGVELGQLAVIALALPAAWWVRRGPAWRADAAAIALGGAGLAWTLERVLVMLP